MFEDDSADFRQQNFELENNPNIEKRNAGQKMNENVLLKTITNTNPLIGSTQDNRVETDQSFTKSMEYENMHATKIVDAGS